jgi:hypothetical protein
MDKAAPRGWLPAAHLVYLPIFDRLEREIADHEKASSLFDRAKAIANG